jgi:predicted DNA-binding protein
MKMSPRTGRPKSDNPKSTQLAVRLDNDTLNKLDEVSKVNSETRVQTIRRGIEKLYSELNK